MNKRIRGMIDAIFSEMKMTAENLALRDEMMANAQDRYEDALREGKSEEAAFAEVAESLGDVKELLEQMRMQEETGEEQAARENEREQAEENGEKREEADELKDRLNGMFSALGDLGRSVVPQAKKWVKEVDKATGGMLRDLKRVTCEGVREAQRTAGDVIDRMNAGKTAKEPTPEQLRREAAAIREEAEKKQRADDQEGARVLRAKAYAMEQKAEQMEEARKVQHAREEAERAQRTQEPIFGADGEIDPDVFARAVDDMAREAADAAGEADGANGETCFAASGLRSVKVKLDADDVQIERGEGAYIRVLCEGIEGENTPKITMDDHVLCVSRRNDDVFATFFSVFARKGGKITIRIPYGYAADYVLSTTSGNITVGEIDADNLKVNTASGMVCIRTDAGARLQNIEVSGISGDTTISACAERIKLTTVSGRAFVSCDCDTLEAASVSGKVHAEGSAALWDVDSVSGEVEMVCTVAPERKINLNTVSANVRVALPEEIRGFAANISGVGGRIVNEFGPNHYGTCALPIHMDTISGSLMLMRL